MQNTQKLQSEIGGSFGQMPSPGQNSAPPDQLKIIVNFNPRLISIMMLVLSFSSSQTPAAKERIVSFHSFYFSYLAKEKQQ